MHPPTPQPSGISKIVLSYAILASVWIVFSDQAVAWLFDDAAQIAFAGVLKGCLFIMVTSWLLFVVLQRRNTWPAAVARQAALSRPRWFTGLFLLLSVLIAVVGGMAFRGVSNTLKSQLNDELDAVAEFKAAQAENWLAMHRRLAAEQAQMPLFVDALRLWQQQGHLAVKQRLQQSLEFLRTSHELSATGIALLNAEGSPLLSAGVPGWFSHDLAGLIQQATRQADVVFIDVHREAQDKTVRIDLLAAIREPGDVQPPLGFLFYTLDLNDNFFTMVQSWPRRSASAETLIVRQEGSEVVFLNPLRHSAAEPLSLRLPLGDMRLPAVQALSLGLGLYEGLDYRGVPVLAAARPVKGTSWMLLAKIDQSEVYGNIRTLAVASIIMAMGIIATVGALLSMAWRQQRLQDSLAAQMQLEASEQRLRQSQHYGGIGCWEADFADNQQFWSETVTGLLGFPPLEKPTWEDFLAVVVPEDRQRLIDATRAHVERGEKYDVEYRIAAVDGQLRWMRSAGQVEWDAHGKPLRMRGIVQDISVRKNAELALRESEARLHAIIGTTLDAVVEMDTEGRIVSWNDSAEKIFGWTSAEVVGRALEDTIIPPQYREAHRWGVQRFLSTGQRVILNSRLETSALHRQGHEFFIELALTAINVKDVPVFCAFIRDISERKRAELLLQQSDLRFRTLFESSPDPVWIIENGRFVQCNQAAVAMLGYHGKEDVLGSHPAQLSPAKQADGENSHAKAERMMAIALERGINRFEWMHRRADGSNFPAEVTLSAFSLEERPVIYCAWRDISERKQAEESMRLAALVYEHSSEAMTVTDANGTILAVNPAFTQVTDYTQEEVIGKNPNILSSGQHGPAFYQAMWQAINSGGHWQGEIWNRRKSGELYPEWLTINTIFAQDGGVHRRVALFTDISEKKASDELIWKQANFDFLTGLPNRRMFLDRLAQEMKQALRDHSLLVLMFLDLDHFKEVNDILGHARGDSLLQEVARRLVECVRDSDTVARLGGDEFTVILGRVKDITAIDPIAQSILRRLAAPFQLGQEVVHISASLGITLYPEDAGDVETLLKNADQAMYAAKNAGRNRYSYFTRLMQEAAQIRAQLATDLHSALAGEQFLVYYQPVVDFATGRIVKAEALIRWQNPRCGLVSPAAFIPIAEETGLINTIGDWVFRTAVYQAAQWRASLLPDFQISVNKSPAQFRNRSDSGTAWLDYLHALGLPGDSVVVEITEGLLMDGNEEKLQTFRDAGLQIALDDFGTGYSSLAYLKKYDIDYLKIDQSFVRNLAAGSNDMALCEAIIVMAHKLGIKVIAEGVETSEQRDLLAAAGCDYGQGYLFARPMPAQEFEALLRAKDPEIKAWR